MRTIDTNECAKMIRTALKQGFPRTKFSVRKTRSTYSYNIDVRWEDGPTHSQVNPILERFESKGFDGMTDCSYYCGNRTLAGVPVEVHGGYVSGTRAISRGLRKLVADKLAAECGLPPVSIDQRGNVVGEGVEKRVPFNWYASWREGPFSVDEFQTATYVLASDQHNGEWFSTLVWRIESQISLEAQCPISPDLLPEYIDLNATVSTGRASFEEPHKMFEGHAAFQGQAQTVENLVADAVNVPVEFHCSVGRSYPKPPAPKVADLVRYIQ